VVAAVNDAPGFVVGPDQTVLEDAGPQTVVNWARNISAGPADEAGQSVRFLVVSNSNPFLFSSSPVVSAAGTLTYTPAPNANGTALITLVLQDNGGTANGGSDASAAQSFRITVTPVNDPPYANSQTVSLNQDSSVSFTLSAGDVDGDALSYTLTSPAHGTLSGTPPNLVYTPKQHFSGPDSFTFKVSDGRLESAVATVTFDISHLNHPPIAIARIYSPTLVGTNETNAVVIAPDNHTAVVIFDSSLSSDSDNDPLHCYWYEAGTNAPFAQGIRVTNSVPVGSYNVVLVVADSSSSSAASVELQVASGAELVGELIHAIQTSGLPPNSQNALIASLQSAINSFDKMNFNAAINQLNAFENKVHAQLSRTNPELAGLLLGQADDIINAMNGYNSGGKK